MIKELIEKLCCKHQWREMYMVDMYSDLFPSKRPVATKVTLCCTKCGKIKRIKI